MRVVLSETSNADLEDVGDIIAQDNPQRARSFVLELRSACLSLRGHPQRFAVVRDRPEPLRRMVHGSYLIFYAVRSDHVRIVRVIHSARLIRLDMFL